MSSGIALQNNSLKLKAVDLRNNASGGVTQAIALMRYGGSLPKLGQLYPFFADRALFERHKDFLLASRPFVSRTHVAFSRMPLGDSIEQDGKDQFLVDRSGGAVWRFQLDSEYLKSKNIPLSQKGVIFAAEKGYKVRLDGPGQYTTLIKNPFECLGSFNLPAANCRGDTSEFPLLFGENGARFVYDVYMWFNPTDVKVGAASAGSNHGFNFKYASIAVRQDALFSALVSV